MNKRNTQLFLCFILSVVFMKAAAQQSAQYSQYMFNSLVINPAYAGYKETLNLSLLHRNQWVDVPGAPKTQSFIADAVVANGKIGLGLSAVNDKLGIENEFSVFANVSYRLKVGDESILALGLGLGAGQFGINGDKVSVDIPETNLNVGRASSLVPEARFGVHFSNEKFYAGVSTTNLFVKDIDFSNNSQELIVSQGRHFFLTAGYLLDVSDFLKFKPSFLVREDTKGPTNLDVNNFFLLGEKVWVGASYRTSLKLWEKSGLVGNISSNNSVVGLVEFFAGSSFRIGYSYDYSLSKFNGYDKGSHEFSLGFVLGGSRKNLTILSPRYF